MGCCLSNDKVLGRPEAAVPPGPAPDDRCAVETRAEHMIAEEGFDGGRDRAAELGEMCQM